MDDTTIDARLADDLYGKFCCARGCATKRDPQYLFCTPHWQKIPPVVARRLIRAVGSYLKTPTRSHRHTMYDALNSCKVAIDWAVSQETQALARSRR